MLRNRLNVWQAGEYSYALAYGFEPFIECYLHDGGDYLSRQADTFEYVETKNDFQADSRPCMLIAPGGAYKFVSPSEAQPVAQVFFDKGYNVFVLTYTTNAPLSEPLHLQPLKDISRAVRVIRKNAAGLEIDADKLAICGFSAGGHLCASLAVHHQDIADENSIYSGISNRPDAVILSYPVITTGMHMHAESFCALTGAAIDPAVSRFDESKLTEEMRRELDYMSLDKHISDDTPPCLLWHTAPDASVPVENSYVFAAACHKYNIPCALHIFSKGVHGMSVANRQWAYLEYTETYTLAQHLAMEQAVKDGRLTIPNETQELLDMLKGIDKNKENLSKFTNDPDTEIAVWPDIADSWLKDLFYSGNKH